MPDDLKAFLMTLSQKLMTLSTGAENVVFDIPEAMMEHEAEIFEFLAKTKYEFSPHPDGTAGRYVVLAQTED